MSLPVPILHSQAESGNSYKVRLLVSLLNIEIEVREVDYFNGQHRSPEFLSINSRGTIPTLVTDNKIYTDSIGILVYLAATYADRNSWEAPSSYWSSQSAEQAEIVDWLAFDGSWIAPGLSSARRIVSFGTPGTTDKELKDAQDRGRRSLEILQHQLEKTKWLVSGRPTIADVALFPYVALAPMGDISLEPYPAVQAWVERIRNLEGFISMQGMDDPMYRRNV